MGEETRRAVLEAAARLGYRPSRVATALRTSRTGIVAVSIPAYAGLRGEGHRDYADFYMRFVYSATLAAVGREFNVLVVPDLTSMSQIESLGVDGVILCDPNAAEQNEHFDPLTALIETGIPVVVHEPSGVRPAFPAIAGIDNTANITLLLNHLVDSGGSRVALVMPDTRGGRASPTVDEIQQAYHVWCRQHGRPDRLELISGDDLDEAAFQHMLGVLDHDDRPDAVIDFLPAATLRAAVALGLNCPKDILITTYTDGPSARALQLTALNQLPELLGQSAIRLLAEQMNGQVARSEFTDSQLVVRASTSIESMTDVGSVRR